MNERIKQLMAQTLDDKFSYTWTTMTYEDLTKFSDKFAELIVKECAGIVDTYGRWILYDKLAVKLKKEFGVEE